MNGKWNRLLALILVAAFAAAAPADDAPPPEEDRAPVPAAAEQERAAEMVRDLFAREYARPGSVERRALAEKFIEQAGGTGDDPAARYVLLREARDLAAKAGDVAMVDKAVESLVELYDVGVDEAAEPALKALAGTAAGPDALAALVGTALRAAEAAVGRGDFAAATRFTDIAKGAARRAKSVPLTSSAAATEKQIAAERRAFEKVKGSVARLAKDPDDPAANLDMGKYLCFVKGDWDRGLRHLARGGDDTLEDLAAKDLAAPETPEAQVQVADGWYELAASAEPAERASFQRRAYHWYDQASGGMTGLSKVRVERRMRDLDKAMEGRHDRSELWRIVRRAVKEGQTQKTQMVGGGFGRDMFEEKLDNPGVLIGFRYRLGKWVDITTIDFLQPVYLTPAGERLGPAYGDAKKGPVQSAKAKPGYAVGEMVVHGGGNLDGFSLTFMRIGGKGLRPEDSYSTAWIGGPGGDVKLGAATPILALHGRKHEDGRAAGLGIVHVKPEQPDEKGDKGKAKKTAKR